MKLTTSLLLLGICVWTTSNVNADSDRPCRRQSCQVRRCVPRAHSSCYRTSCGQTTGTTVDPPSDWPCDKRDCGNRRKYCTPWSAIGNPPIYWVRDCRCCRRLDPTNCSSAFSETCRRPNAATQIERNSRGEALIGVEDVNGERRLYFQSEGDIDLMLSRIADGQTKPNRDDLLKSTCSSNSSGGCSGKCDVFPTSCYSFQLRTIDNGTLKFCECR